MKEEYDSDPSDTGSSDNEGSGSGSEGEKEKRRKVEIRARLNPSLILNYLRISGESREEGREGQEEENFRPKREVF